MVAYSSESFRRSTTVPAVLWTVLVLVSAAVFFQQLRGGLHLEADLLRLLPPTAKDPTIESARLTFMRTVSQRAFMLLDAPTFEVARAATERYHTLLVDSGAFSSVVSRGFSGDASDFEQLFFPHREALVSEEVSALFAREDAAVVLRQRLERILATPLSGVLTKYLDQDPLLLYGDFLRSLPKPPGTLVLRDGYLTREFEGRQLIFVYAVLAESVFSRTAQISALEALKRADAALGKFSPEIKVRHTGALQFADAMASESEADVNRVSYGSLIGTVVLVLLAFYSVSPMLLSMLTVLVGVLFAMVVSLWGFGELHVLTLGFGASLIGVCADYSFHFFCHRLNLPHKPAKVVLRAVLPGISVGVLTSVLGYLGLFFTPFPGLRQMSVFAIVGMVASYLCVLFWLPLLGPGREVRVLPPLLRMSLWWLQLTQHQWAQRAVRVLALLSLPLLIWGIWQLRVDDDVRQLQRPPQRLVVEDKEFRALVGAPDSSRFFVVTGANPEEVLQTEELLLRKLRELQQQGGLESYQSLSALIPSQRTQHVRARQVCEGMLKHASALTQQLQDLGVSGDSLQRMFSRCQNAQAMTLGLDQFLSSPTSLPFRHLWLGQVSGGFASLVTLGKIQDERSIRTLPTNIPHTLFVDNTADVSAVLGHYRRSAGVLVGGCYLLIGVFLMLRYGVRRGLMGMVPAVLSVLITFAALGLSGKPLTLFGVLAVIIVLGLAIDYAVFLLEGVDDHGPTMMAIVLSTLSTMLSFGLLALSSTAVLQSFGFSLFLGVLVAMATAPLIIPHARERSAAKVLS